MATTVTPPAEANTPHMALARWVLLGILALLVALVVFAFLRPLTVLIYATQARLFFDGIHSDYTELTFAGAPHVRVHYYAGGSGSPVVLVHGLGGRAEDWAGLMPQLVRDHHRVYALDLPGYGRSEWPANAAYSIPEQVALVEAFLDSRGLASTDLAGWSMGGWVAMRLALDQPQRVRRLYFRQRRHPFPSDLGYFALRAGYSGEAARSRRSADGRAGAACSGIHPARRFPLRWTAWLGRAPQHGLPADRRGSARRQAGVQASSIECAQRPSIVRAQASDPPTTRQRKSRT